MEEQEILGRCERWVVMEEGEMKGRDGRERDLAMGEIVEAKQRRNRCNFHGWEFC